MDTFITLSEKTCVALLFARRKVREESLHTSLVMPNPMRLFVQRADRHAADVREHANAHADLLAAVTVINHP